MSSSRTSHMMTVAVATLAVMLMALPAASSIKCYQCNSIRDPFCRDLKANASASQSYLRECTDPLPENATHFCRKMVQTVLQAGETRYIRKCGWEKSAKPCYHYDDEDHGEIVCQCFDEACNAAPRVRSGVAGVAAAAVSVFLLLLAR